MADVFLSYAREDHGRASELAAALNQRGFDVWWDRTLVAGSRFDEVIEQELHNAGCVVVLWSTKSVKSRWVRAEAEYAAERGTLIPVLIETEAAAMIPLGMRAFQFVDASSADSTDAGADAIAAGAARLAAPSRTSAPAAAIAGSEHTQRPRPKRRRVAQLSAGGLAAVVVIGLVVWFKTRPATSAVRPWVPPVPTFDRPDPTLRFSAAAQHYREDRVNDAVATLRSIAGDVRFERHHRVVALDISSQLLVTLGQRDSARTVINDLLDLEPPLILVTPEQGSTELGRLYDMVRRERLSQSVRRPNSANVQDITVLPFQQLSGGPDYAGMGSGLRDLLITELSSVRGIRILERATVIIRPVAPFNEGTRDRYRRGTLPHGATLVIDRPRQHRFYSQWLRRQSLLNGYAVVMRPDDDTTGRLSTSPADVILDLLPTERRAFYEPAELENRFATAIILHQGGIPAAHHVLTGSFVADGGRVVISAWVFHVNTGVVDAVAVVRAPPDNVIGGIATLSRQLASQLGRAR